MSDHVYVGEVTVWGIVEGTALDPGNGVLDSNAIAGPLWKLFSERKDAYESIG